VARRLPEDLRLTQLQVIPRRLKSLVLGSYDFRPFIKPTYEMEQPMLAKPRQLRKRLNVNRPEFWAVYSARSGGR
jgi:hypothetical protein